MKRLLKNLFGIVMYLLVLPMGLSARWLYRMAGSSALFDLWAQYLSLWPGFVGTYARVRFYRQTLPEAYTNMFIGFGSFISKIETRIGRGVAIGSHSTIGLAVIGDGVVIANYVSVLSGGRQHNFDDPEQGILSTEGEYACIHIGRDVFVGDKSVVMADIGEKTIVGAGSIVVKPIPPYSIAVGNPAKVVRDRRAQSGN